MCKCVQFEQKKKAFPYKNNLQLIVSYKMLFPIILLDTIYGYDQDVKEQQVLQQWKGFRHILLSNGKTDQYNITEPLSNDYFYDDAKKPGRILYII